MHQQVLIGDVAQLGQAAAQFLAGGYAQAAPGGESVVGRRQRDFPRREAGVAQPQPDGSVESAFVYLAQLGGRQRVCIAAFGVLAPVVAFVPVPDVGTCTTFQPSLSQDTVAAIGNNIAALLGAGLLAFVVYLALTRGRTRTPVPASVRRARVIGTAVTGLLLAGGFVWFQVDRPSFDCGAHFAAAIPLFGCIIGVAVLNAVTRTQEHLAEGLSLGRAIRNRYTVIVVLIALVLLAAIPVQLSGSRFTVLFLEAGVLLFFLVFWILQSAELWDRGRRDSSVSVLPRRPISRPPRS